MEKALSLEIKLSQGPRAAGSLTVSRVNEDMAGAGAGEKGTLAFLLSVQGNSSELEQARELASSFEEKYLASPEGTILAALEEALEAVKKQATDQPALELVAAVVWGPVLYIGKIGEETVTIFREGVANQIGFSYVASGFVRDGETICLGNAAFGESLNQEELSLILARVDLAEVKKKLDENLRSRPAASSILIRVGLKATQAEIAPIQFVDTDQHSLERKAFSKDLFANFSGKIKAGLEVAYVWLKPHLSKALAKAKEVFQKLAQPWQKRLPGEIYDERKRKRARFVQVAVGLGLILVVSVTLSLAAAASARQNKEQQEIISQIQSKLAQAKTLVVTNPQAAAGQLAEVSKLLDTAKTKKLNASKLTVLQSQYETLLAENQKLYQVEPTLVIDLAKSHLTADEIVLDSQGLVGLDAKAGKLLSIAATGVTSLSTALEGGQILGSEEAFDYITSTDSAWRFDRGQKTLVKVVSGETAWSKVTDTAVYSGNLYVLDPVKEQVWKSTSGTVALGGARGWFSGSKPPLTAATALAVDGNVWVGTRDGAIYKFAAGKQQPFSLHDGPEGLSISKVLTTDQSNHLYLLDSKSARVVVFDKTGQFLGSYKNEILKTAKTIAVDETSKQIYFTTGDKVYKFGFK